MSTIVSFMPMNVRLYDRDERELRTYVSPEFTCAEHADDERGLSCHIVADNGGGKSTLLLFFEMLFCKPDRNGPAVGHKKAIDYLRRASRELDDNTPTSMAALVRRDDPSLMHSARDVIFGYSVGLRGADGASLDLRRFVIHLDENPGFTLDALARDYIYDSPKDGEAPKPRTLKNLWERLHELPGCRLYESSEWDAYTREMAETGVSPILWRELARMNQDEEAAGDYFATGDAFKKIVNLISESLEPLSGERRKPLAETAATIARQVSEQGQDRRREKACDEAATAISALAKKVESFAEAREALKLAEDEAHLVARSLGETLGELDDHIAHLEDAEENYRKLRRHNEQLHVSSRILELERTVAERQARADVLLSERAERRRCADEAARSVALDDAAKSRRRWLALDTEIKAQQEEIAVLEGKMERDEELSRARSRAWAGADQVTRTTRKRLRTAKGALREAEDIERQTRQAVSEADDDLQQKVRALGHAQARLENARARLEEAASGVTGLDTIPQTLSGLFSDPSLAGLIRKAEERERACAQAEASAEIEVSTSSERLDEAREGVHTAQVTLASAKTDATTWEHNCRIVETADQELRDAVTLFEDVSEHVLAGRYEEALSCADAQRASFENGAREEDDRARMQESRLRALEEGRLDTTSALRAWLDRHGVRAVTLSGHRGIPRDVADALFERYPWLAHALVVDGPGLKALERAAAQEDPAELGQPVFYIEQANIQALLDSLQEGRTLPETADGTPLLHALQTVERASVDDAEGFSEELRRRAEAARTRAASARGMAERLERTHDLIKGFETMLTTLGMPAGSTLPDVIERTRAAQTAQSAAEHQLEASQRNEQRAQAALDEAKRRLEDARTAHASASEHVRALEVVRRLNAGAEEAAGHQEEAERLERTARERKASADAAHENARTTLRTREDELERNSRETEAAEALASRLSALSPRSDDLERPLENVPATITELEGAINALDVILSRIDADLHGATERLSRLTSQQSAELRWQEAIAESETEGIPFTLEDVDAWVPADKLERDRLLARRREANAAAREADSAYRQAHTELTIANGERVRAYEELAGLGLTEPLEIPLGYDHAAEEARIRADEQADREALATAREDREQLRTLVAQADLTAERASRDDGYRASASIEVPTFVDLAGRKAHVNGLGERQRQATRTLNAVLQTLDACTDEARAATERADEHQVARNIADSVQSVKGVCTTKASIQKVALELDGRSEMLKSMVLTLRNRLKATNESIEDLVEQARSVGYQLTEQLHRLSVVSRASIKGSRPQRTIDFRSRGRTVFAEEFRHDDVATARLTNQVRTFITEELPKIEEGRRLERAEARLAPHELVYLLLDDRSVDVRYPVIRGGARLSYESTRDASGSGSTGQKSAGYVLSFLALLRYLGNVGALSSENSLFVALENQFGKISSTSIIADIKEVTEQTHMQLVTVAGRELRSAYAMGDVVYTLYRTRGSASAAGRNVSAMRARREDEETPIRDCIIDRFRATRRFENLSFDF